MVKAPTASRGDTVATGALLVEFEPDPAAADPGTVVGRMPTSDADFFEDHSVNNGGAAAPYEVASRPGHIRAVPAARAIAGRLGIDLTQVRGTGRGGLVTVDDVVDASAAPTSSPTAAFAAAPGATEQLHGPRRAMAQTMAIARDTVMGCTLFDDADLHEWDNDQDITGRLLRAISEACAAEPGLNAWFDAATQSRKVFSHIDVAIAVDTSDGLIVPVVRDIAGQTVAELRRDVDRLKRGTHSRTLQPGELRDFTFMLSNFGMLAGRYATPVVVPPAVAILGAGRLNHDVVATRGGKIAAHLRMPLSLTFDHRCVTGGEAARFMAASSAIFRKAVDYAFAGNSRRQPSSAQHSPGTGGAH